jgi:hypothetical protein
VRFVILPCSAASHAHHPALDSFGLVAASWLTASEYETGLRQSLGFIKSLARTHGVRVLWRETTAVFPRSAPNDPLYEINPRVELVNRIANRLVDEAGIARLGAYEMTASRGDAAKDNSHLCPTVQGDLVETLMFAICRHVLAQ